MRVRLVIALSCLASTMAVIAADDPGPLTIPAAKAVSLNLEKTSTTLALAELSKQTGFVVGDRLGSRSNTFDLAMPHTTFWPALDAIARKAHGRVELYSRDGRLALLPQSAGYLEPPLSYSGLFRTALTRITVSRDLETGVSACTARIEVAWEPTLEPLLLETSPQNLVVRDDAGRDLAAPAEGSVVAPVDGRLAFAIDVALPVVPRSVRRLSSVEGKLGAVAPSKMVSFGFDTLDRLNEVPADSPLRRREQDGVTCRISRVQLTPDRWTVQVALAYPRRGVQLESYQSRVVNNEMMLEAKDGSKRLSPGGYVVETATDRQATISYHFFDTDKRTRGPASNWRVRYRTPAALVEVPLTFSFKDVALP
jgi:hypothetical protein